MQFKDLFSIKAYLFLQYRPRKFFRWLFQRLLAPLLFFRLLSSYTISLTLWKVLKALVCEKLERYSRKCCAFLRLLFLGFSAFPEALYFLTKLSYPLQIPRLSGYLKAFHLFHKGLFLLSNFKKNFD